MLTRSPHKENANKWYFAKSAEVTLQCSVCFAMETLLFEDGKLVNTKKWTQIDGNIYHCNCGKPAQPFGSSKGWLIPNTADKVFLKDSIRTTKAEDK